MATWRVTYTLIDDLSPTPSVRLKTFTGDFADYAAATAAETTLRTDITGVSGAGIAKAELTEVTVLTPTITAGANNFEVASVTLPINPVKNANMQIPAAIPAMQLPGNVIDTAYAPFQTFIDNFTSAGGWTISDGENVDTTLGYGTGKLVFVRSGKSFNS